MEEVKTPVTTPPVGQKRQYGPLPEKVQQTPPKVKKEKKKPPAEVKVKQKSPKTLISATLKTKRPSTAPPTLTAPSVKVITYV